MRIDGKDLNGKGPDAFCRRGVARTFQTPRVFGDITVRDNVRFTYTFGNRGKTDAAEICRRGTGILLVEQNVRQALGVCDHAYILKQGAVVAESSRQELLQGERIRKSYLGM